MTHYSDGGVTLHHGDCLDILRELPDDSVDSVVTDPPYGLEFMGREWDGADGFRRSLNNADVSRDNAFGRTSRTSPEYRAGSLFQEWCEAWATECLRVLKPGGHLLAFGGTRTSHRLACAVEDAGFEIRDSIAWLYGSGFPKSLDVSKAIDKAAGAEREVLRPRLYEMTDGGGYSGNLNTSKPRSESSEITAPATDDARTWQGWGTALKPAHEPIVVARKPLTGTVAANVLTHGTGALNVDACRVEGGERPLIISKSEDSTGILGNGLNGSSHGGATSAGRWPANVILDESQAEALDAQSGESTSKSGGMSGTISRGGTMNNTGEARTDERGGHDDRGGASRFFYVAKADASERVRVPARRVRAASCRVCEAARANGVDPMTAFVTPAYPEHVEEQHAIVDASAVAHPTVKPLALMRWLVRLVTPPGGTVLEPFAGSGTTVEACIREGFRCVAIEREADYLPLILKRIERGRGPNVRARSATPPDLDDSLLSFLETDQETA